MRWTLALLVSIGIVAAGACAQPRPAGSVIASADLLADLAVMREAYTALHPGLYRYLTPAELDAAWDELAGEFSRDRTRGEAYLAFSRFLGKLRCGHSYCNFYNQPGEVSKELFTAGRLPFHFRWVTGRMIITENRSDDPRLAPGIEVVAIDGIPAGNILEQLWPLARADGASDEKRARALSVDGGSRFEAFDIFFPLVFPERGQTYEVAIKGPGLEPIPVRVPALAPGERAKPGTSIQARIRSNEPVWEWRMIDDRTAYLAMPSWALFNSKWEWQGWLNQRLDDLVKAGTPNFIIDLRGNEGGLDCGDLILSRLVDSELPARGRRLTRYAKTPEHLNKYLNTWDDSFRDFSARVKPAAKPSLVTDDGVYFEEQSPTFLAINPRGPRYSGRVYVLIDSACSSATFVFARRIQEHKLGTLVGEATGGNLRGINGGYFFFLRLPNSKIEMDIPLIGQFPPDCEQTPDRPILPDVPVRFNPVRDDALNRVLELIRG